MLPLFLIIAQLFICGCTQQLAFSGGSDLPTVVVIPTVDHSEKHLPWNLSHELTSELQDCLLVKNQLRVAHVDKQIEDLFEIKQKSQETEFAVFTELLEHQMRDDEQLQITMSLHVYDLRMDSPRLLFQETLRTSSFLPHQLAQPDWGKNNYSLSPLGMAHSGLTQQIAEHIENSILSSQGS